ncbi:MAG TPA: hypothetical protein VJ650_07845 [Gemmatimonadaceae bacterium]|nr:hypothetical protein [Gemmatimonadaceae bacterium]
MLRTRSWIVVLIAALGGDVAAAQTVQDSLILRTPGRGRPGVILQEVLARPYTVLTADSVVRLPRDSTIDRTVIILGGDATVASTVRGDVIVIDGDLFLHPGAAIDGRAVAIGGGVYPSSLATVALGIESFRDVTYDIARRGDGRAYLDWRVISPVTIETVTFPIVFGLRLPTYTRVDGLALPWGPRIMLDTGRIVIDPLITYRSDLGEFDPSVTARLGLGRLTSLEIRAGRGTFTNDAWIQSDLANSIPALIVGRDYRNYWRADRAEALLQRRWERAATMLAVEIGGRTERAWSVNAGGPWSVVGRDDVEDGMLRFNPPVLHGRITSALAGGRFDWERQQVSLTTRLLTEIAIDAPNDAQFTQATLDALVAFPSFRNHTFSFEAHAVHTFGDTAPPQRFAYLGGGGTLPTFDLLEFGGDRLLFFESRYSIPIERIQLPIVGSPVIMFRHMIGMAGVDSLPPFEQNIGVRLRVGPLKVDWTIDPVSRDSKFSAGLALVR